jgi:hypothetical protein
MNNQEIMQVVEDLEPKVERLKSLYQQFFMGIEKIPPAVLRKDVDRTIWLLRRERVQNTRVRFKFQQLIQRYNTYQQYWARIMRDIEKGTYKRDVVRAAKRFGRDEVIHASGRAAELALRGLESESESELEVDVDIDEESSAWDVDDSPTPPQRPAQPSARRPVAYTIDEDDDEAGDGWSIPDELAGAVLAPTPRHAPENAGTPRAPGMAGPPRTPGVWQVPSQLSEPLAQARHPQPQPRYEPPLPEPPPPQPPLPEPPPVEAPQPRASQSLLGRRASPPPRTPAPITPAPITPAQAAPAPQPPFVPQHAPVAQPPQQPTAQRVFAPQRQASAPQPHRALEAQRAYQPPADAPDYRGAPPPAAAPPPALAPQATRPKRQSGSMAAADARRAQHATAPIPEQQQRRAQHATAPLAAQSQEPAQAEPPLAVPPSAPKPIPGARPFQRQLPPPPRAPGAPPPPVVTKAPPKQETERPAPAPLPAEAAPPSAEAAKPERSKSTRPRKRPSQKDAPAVATEKHAPAAAHAKRRATTVEKRTREIYNAYVQMRREAGESTANVTFDKLERSLSKQRDQLKEKHAGRDVDFEVVKKDGRTVIRPVIK